MAVRGTLAQKVLQSSFYAVLQTFLEFQAEQNIVMAHF
jgi:hypothetical protein